MRAQRSGGGRTGHETRSNSTIASCINPTLPTMLVVLMHVCMYTRTQNTQPHDFEGPESCHRSLSKDYPSSAPNLDESRRVALGCSPHGAKHGGLGRPVILKY